MRLAFDGKSAVVGAVAGAALVAGFGAMQPEGRSGIRGPKPEDQFEGRPGGGPLGQEHEGPQPTSRPMGVVGRFELEAVSSGNGNHHAYLVDTTTGQVWEYGQQTFSLPKIGGGL